MFRQVPKCPPPPTPAASRESLAEFFTLLKQSQKPLVIIGKGHYSCIHLCLPHVFLFLRLFLWCC
jgi:hypothetical protein